MKILSFLLLAAVLLAACTGNDAADLMSQARALEEEGKTDEALTLYENITRDFETSDQAPEALFKSAAMYYTLQADPLKAATTYELVCEKYPESEFAHKGLFIAGFTYANELQNYERAKSVYNRYLELYPDSSMVKTVKFELDNLGKSPEKILESLQQNTADAPPLD